ncbi:MAG: O-antigen ligase family protein [Candidatus Aminicenantes bacterium]|nr:O-antigen ligase family protein [Candidatus Aminicenantes bacterium]
MTFSRKKPMAMFNSRPAPMFEGKSPTEILLWASITAGLLFSLISISLVQLCLGLAVIGWTILLVRKRRPWRLPPFAWPLLAYVVLSLIASALSRDPATSFIDSKELLLTLIVPVVLSAFFSAKALTFGLWAFLASAAVSSGYSLVLYFVHNAPGLRVSGFMGHYMTQAGLLMLFGAAALSLALFLRDKSRWAWGLGLALSLPALALTLTRSAWIGFLAAACFLILIYKPKALLVIPVFIGLFFLVAPKPMKHRALSIFSSYGYSNQERIAYFKAGLKIIKNYPWHGTGPDTADKIFQYPEYGLSEQAKKNVHLHNNLIQIAAERGLPALAAWLAFLGVALISLAKIFKSHGGPLRALAAAALAVLVALFVGGFFEYNFGDSEITSLFYILITLPYARQVMSRREDIPGYR